LREVLQKGISNERAEQIIAQARSAGGNFNNVFDFAAKSGIGAAELSKVIDRLSSVDEKTAKGLVNVYTAPREVLLCVPGLESGDVDSLLAARDGHVAAESDTAPPDMAWVAEALTKEKAAAAGDKLTNRSFQYTADILAVSGDGRAFKRVRITVDGRKSPPVITRRKELSAYGWPLPEDMRETLRSGSALPTRVANALPQGQGG
jgi:hypothetical protein